MGVGLEIFQPMGGRKGQAEARDLARLGLDGLAIVGEPTRARHRTGSDDACFAIPFALIYGRAPP
jgi:hypothetical protein